MWILQVHRKLCQLDELSSFACGIQPYWRVQAGGIRLIVGTDALGMQQNTRASQTIKVIC